MWYSKGCLKYKLYDYHKEFLFIFQAPNIDSMEEFILDIFGNAENGQKDSSELYKLYLREP